MAKNTEAKDSKGGREFNSSSHFGRMKGKPEGPINMRKAMAMGHDPLGKEPNVADKGGKVPLNRKANDKNDY